MQTGGKLFPPFTLASRSVVPAFTAFSSGGMAEVRVAVALAGAAAGEAPLAGLAVGAAATHSSVFAAALARSRVALLLQGALRVAVAGWGGDHTP